MQPYFILHSQSQVAGVLFTVHYIIGHLSPLHGPHNSSHKCTDGSELHVHLFLVNVVSAPDPVNVITEAALHRTV